MTARVDGHWVMYCIVFTSRDVDAQAREFPMAARWRERLWLASPPGPRLVGAGSSNGGGKVIGSSEYVHVVDALAMTGEEGRDSLR